MASSSSEPPQQSQEPQQQQLQSVKDRMHNTKQIKFFGGDTRIVLQKNNGACPLLAICNVLFLRNNLNLSAATTEVSQEELLSLVKELIESKSNTDNKDAGYVENQQQKIKDAIYLLPRLATRIDVNIKFTGISDFELTPERAIFDLLDIPLYHGWIVNPQDNRTANAIGSKSYSTLMGEPVAPETQNMEREPIRTFLEDNASQLTSYGLLLLKKELEERRPCVFFRNNHFSTMLKFEGELYLLVTDQGYLNQHDLVWEKLIEVNGDRVFMTGKFEEFKVANQSTENNAVTADHPGSTDRTASDGFDLNSDSPLAITLQPEKLEVQAQEQQPQGRPLLHGSLVIHVNEARMLPGESGDVYVTVSLSNAVIGRTSAKNINNPVWVQHFDVPVAHYASEVIFAVKSSSSKTIGFVGIPFDRLRPANEVAGFFPIRETTTGALLSLSIQYTSVEKLPFYNCGVGSDHLGVPGTYFPLRKGGKVILYQDAHVPDDCLRSVKLDDDVEYEHGRCWQDIYNAIKDAQHLIYIAGWSLNPLVKLLRNGDGSANTTLGDLLKAKAKAKPKPNAMAEDKPQEGVKVVLLVWEDRSSSIKKGGFMGTGAKEARGFFEGSEVQFLLCRRSSLWENVAKNESYTHHQKIVLVDADAGKSKRKIIAFVGGLDLCLGRYDTPEHSLFRTLQTVHKDDYHNPTLSKRVVGCPREPWHDLHCKIEGPAAYDILTNFVERYGNSKTPKRGDALLKIEEIPGVLMAKDSGLSENDIEAWDVQVFRSIDSSSVERFAEDPEVGRTKNLVSEKNVLIDMSIQAAYVKAIRAAKKFIYIENQYFLGSSYNWDLDDDKEITSRRSIWNLIPMEIALKIVNKIKADERFSVYVVIPMWPEVDPSGVSEQLILLWQNKTMRMMYKMIYDALRDYGREGHPTDYLNFFCLGNREKVNGEDNSAASEADSPHARVQKSRRFMIYVHSKGMIVDDEYVILGSANINQRSMGGSRDTEIAMGAYQPHHTWATKPSSPQGKVYGYRMSLWQEHIGRVEECFKQPWSLDCVKMVRTLSAEHWGLYVADEVTDMKGRHLLKYPIEVDQTGQVTSLSGCKDFPDFGGYILGSPTKNPLVPKIIKKRIEVIT